MRLESPSRSARTGLQSVILAVGLNLPYFHPYKHLYGEDRDAELPLMLPKMQAARTRLAYGLAIAEMGTHAHDSHVGARSPDILDFRGANTAPSVEIRWIEQQPVVTRLLDPSLAGRVAPGDIVVKLNGNRFRNVWTISRGLLPPQTLRH